MNIAVITARSGSKGLKDKNIKPLMGLPLMGYTIKAAMESHCFDEIMVSTDSPKYAEIAKELGAKVPFLRSAENSADNASSWDTVREVLSAYKDMGQTFDTVTLLQPTSPLRTAQNIIDGYALMKQKKANAIISVCEPEHSPLLCNTLDDSLCMDGFLSKAAQGRRQEHQKYYRVSGALYIIKTDIIMSKEDIYSENTYALIMDKRQSVDIDDEMDFAIAKALMTAQG